MPLASLRSPHNASSQVDASLLASLVESGLCEQDLVRDVRTQVQSYSQGQEFAREHGWQFVSKPDSVVWVFELGGPDGQRPLQRLAFIRRDGDVILDTLTPEFRQRISMDLRGNVLGNSGKRPR